jgi:magnesium-transporting ATPase (P-type)
VESLLDVLNAFIVAITIVVVAVPEGIALCSLLFSLVGLPLAVTISLAYSGHLMMKDMNLVRHLAACETMGGATNICSDKTGTLTENRMAVVEGWFTGLQSTTQQLLQNRLPKNVENLLLESCILNNDDGALEEVNGEIKFSGNTTECAMLVFAKKLGADYRQIQDSMQPAMKWGFTSAKKRMSSVYKMVRSLRRLLLTFRATFIVCFARAPLSVCWPTARRC